MLLQDLGKASDVTHGLYVGPFTEGGGPPFNKYNCGYPGNPCFPVTDPPPSPAMPPDEPAPAGGNEH